MNRRARRKERWSSLGNEAHTRLSSFPSLPSPVELGVVIGKTARDVSSANAMDHVAGYGLSLSFSPSRFSSSSSPFLPSSSALAIDMTARNVQDHVKAKGLPWSTAKGFDTFNPVSGFIPANLVQDPHKLKLSLSVRGELVRVLSIVSTRGKLMFLLDAMGETRSMELPNRMVLPRI